MLVGGNTKAARQAASLTLTSASSIQQGGANLLRADPAAAPLYQAVATILVAAKRVDALTMESVFDPPKPTLLGTVEALASKALMKHAPAIERFVTAGLESAVDNVPKFCAAAADALTATCSSATGVATAAGESALSLPGRLASSVAAVCSRLNASIMGRVFKPVYEASEPLLIALLQIIILITVTIPLSAQLWRLIPVTLLPLTQLALIFPWSSSRSTWSLVPRLTTTWIIGAITGAIFLLSARASMVPEVVLFVLFFVVPTIALFVSPPLH